jgi:HSP20 family molecular chaperone IbpA
MYEVTKTEAPRRAVFSPSVDIHDTNEGLVLRADLPGVHPDNLDLSVENNVLRIYGKVTATPPEGSKFLHREFREGDYFRSFILGDELDSNEISAELDAGVLTLTVPKAARLRPRRIEVKAKNGVEAGAVANG